jgi:hypothetical protein
MMMSKPIALISPNYDRPYLPQVRSPLFSPKYDRPFLPKLRSPLLPQVRSPFYSQSAIALIFLKYDLVMLYYK